MSYAHLRPADVNQIRVIREIFAGYEITYAPSAALPLTRQALLALGWDSAEAAEGARLAEVAEHTERVVSKAIEITSEHRDKL
jgi:hypothetical protein